MKTKDVILIVDPRPEDRAALRNWLEERLERDTGFVEAGTVREAIEMGEAQNADCVLLGESVADCDDEAIASLTGRETGVSTPVVLIYERSDEAARAEQSKVRVQNVVSRERLLSAETFYAVRNAVEIVAARRSLRALERKTPPPVKRDTVTALPSRVHFRDRLSESMARVDGLTTTGAMLVGLDGFKAVNRSFGHEVGDELLRMVAGRLRHCVRNADTIARWGGDEFAVVLEDLSRPEDATFVAQRIIYALSRPFDHQGQELYVTASIGIAIHPADGEDAESLLQHADRAMYRTKRAGGNNYQLYSAQMDANLADQFAIENRLRTALKRDEFFLQYQPQIDVRDGSIIGLEALLRWNDSDGGVRSPAEFIPILEQTGLIVPVGEWVIRKACTQARAWQYAGLSDLRIAVNLSSKQFHRGELVKNVEHILGETGLAPESLELELTESVLMDDQHYAKTVLSRLKDMGSCIALDDFGTGYSALAFLKAFPVDTLKIDRTFIRDIADDQDDRSICSAIVKLGHDLRLHVLAEGVETEEQVQILKRQGCHLVQGFLYARPMPADDVWEWLTADTATKAAD